jgi:hypothetical protein
VPRRNIRYKFWFALWSFYTGWNLALLLHEGFDWWHLTMLGMSIFLASLFWGDLNVEDDDG